jgi:hypothetical protein
LDDFMAAAKEHARISREPAPDGYTLVAVPDPDWRAGTGKPCRRQLGWGKPACGQFGVAEMRRGFADTPQWWSYCSGHTYGRWVEDGQVMHWVAREMSGSGH